MARKFTAMIRSKSAVSSLVAGHGFESGVVHQDIQRAEGVDRSLKHRHLMFLGNVAPMTGACYCLPDS
jgi:hypothetical protein